MSGLQIDWRGIILLTFTTILYSEESVGLAEAGTHLESHAVVCEHGPAEGSHPVSFSLTADEEVSTDSVLNAKSRR